MHNNIILTAETGSDLTAEAAAKIGVYLVPMHVSMGDITKDDGSFPAEEICAYYDRTHKVPMTSGSSPYDFEKVFDEIHENYPDKQILHLAYSRVTTVSYQSAVIAAQGRDYFHIIDTKHVSVGQCAAVTAIAHYLDAHPDCSIEEAMKAAEEISEHVEMCFLPDNLDYLRAGGRVSNAAALIGNLLGLHSCIEIIDGYLIAKKKYRGSIERIIPKVMKDFDEKHHFDRKKVYFIYSPGLSDAAKKNAEDTAAAMGFREFEWVRTGCVITCHSGPRAFGMIASRN